MLGADAHFPIWDIGGIARLIQIQQRKYIDTLRYMDVPQNILRVVHQTHIIDSHYSILKIIVNHCT